MQLSGKSCRHYHAGAEFQLHLVKLLATIGKTTNDETTLLEKVGKQRLRGQLQNNGLIWLFLSLFSLTFAPP